MSKEAMKLALDYVQQSGFQVGVNEVVTALKEALAKQEQGEPVAWRDRKSGTLLHEEWLDADPLYTTPQQRTWVGLTDEEIRDAIKHSEKVTTEHAGWVAEQRLIWGRSIEAKLKEKNT